MRSAEINALDQARRDYAIVRFWLYVDGRAQGAYNVMGNLHPDTLVQDFEADTPDRRFDLGFGFVSDGRMHFIPFVDAVTLFDIWANLRVIEGSSNPCILVTYLSDAGPDVETPSTAAAILSPDPQHRMMPSEACLVWGWVLVSCNFLCIPLTVLILAFPSCH